MTDNVKLEDMNEEQLRNAVGSLLQQLQQADATIRDLGAKVANKEIENSRFRSILGMNQQKPAPVADKEVAEDVSDEEAGAEEAE
jgi:regulator of replication initiation timing